MDAVQQRTSAAGRRLLLAIFCIPFVHLLFKNSVLATSDRAVQMVGNLSLFASSVTHHYSYASPLKTSRFVP